mmetsp:Transcript_47107/g.121743  ORF Transcript_47107/g.121743 Transcript_47107/m.121743 type:complete len:82 (+) Transcript_47107:1384-1629(+)
MLSSAVQESRFGVSPMKSTSNRFGRPMTTGSVDKYYNIDQGNKKSLATEVKDSQNHYSTMTSPIPRFASTSKKTSKVRRSE